MRQAVLGVMAGVVVLAAAARGAEETAEKFVKFQWDIMGAAHAKDVAKLEELAGKVEEEWPAKVTTEMNQYGRLMLKLIQEIEAPAPAEKRLALVRKYTGQALARVDTLPLELQAAIVGNGLRPAKMAGEAEGDFAKRRAADFEMWLRVWKNIEGRIDENWDAKRDAPPPIKLPEGVEGTLGMPPEDIKDPGKRAEYEASIAVHKAKLIPFLAQVDARLVRDEYLPNLQRYVAAAYGGGNADEVKGLVEKYVEDKGVREKLTGAGKSGG